jgi:hypothetical protein
MISPFKAALWIVKFVASLALLFGVGYAVFLAGALGIAVAADHYQSRKLHKYQERVEECVAKYNRDHAVPGEPPLPAGATDYGVREACDASEAK